MILTNRYNALVELRLDNPPVNALAAELRQTLLAAIEEADGDPAVRAIVISGQGKLFCAGADINEFGKPAQEPSLPSLLDRIEGCSKPVIALINGAALGGGLELALACHYRLAVPGAKLGLPEVKLGLLPGAGGTQRLPRLVGIEHALSMIVGGEPVSAARAREIGLVDELVTGEDIVGAARAYAGKVIEPRPTRDLPISPDPARFERYRAENARRIANLDAPNACIDAIKAASECSFGQGSQQERALFTSLMQGAQSKALRHFFFAERSAARIEGLPRNTVPRPIRSVGIIGAGTMGGGIAMNFLSTAIPVTLVDMSHEALDRGVATIRRNYEATAAKGRMTADQVEAAMALLTPTLDFAALAPCNLVIEAVYENMDAKKEIFSRLDRIMPAGAILASNTSYLNIDEMAAVTDRPGDLVGLHFFSPANVMRLVEVVRGKETVPDVLATAMDVIQRIRKVPVVSGVCYGFIGNRMLIPRQQQAVALVLEGASPEQIDRVHTSFGMPMGPFQMADLAGVDIGWHRDPERIESIRDALCAAGRWGQKTKGGYYDYDEKRRPTQSPVTQEIVSQFRAKAGLAPRQIDDEEIIARTLYTMVNEGLRILEEGIAQRASDIDVVWAYGYGWPTFTGGPMFWGESEGLDKIASALGKVRPSLGKDFVFAKALSSILQHKA